MISILLVLLMISLRLESTSSGYVSWYQHKKNKPNCEGTKDDRADIISSTANSVNTWTPLGRLGYISTTPMANTVELCKYYQDKRWLPAPNSRYLGICRHRYVQANADGTCATISGEDDAIISNVWVWPSVAACELDTQFCADDNGAYCKEVYIQNWNGNEYSYKYGYTKDPQLAGQSAKYVILSRLPANEQATCCIKDNIEYNIEIIIDESGSVNDGNINNYDESINFVINLINKDINSISNIAALAFSTESDFIYTFNNIQSNRDGIINELIKEKSDYKGSITDTYNALIDGINEFKNAEITLSNPNLLILITDGMPNCGTPPDQDPDCKENVCDPIILQDIDDLNIRVITIGITDEFNRQSVECLGDPNDIFFITDFSSTQFDKIEEEIRKIVCSVEVLSDNGIAARSVDIDNIFDRLVNDDNDENMFKTFVLNICVSAITCMVIIGIFLCIYYLMKQIQSIPSTKSLP